MQTRFPFFWVKSWQQVTFSALRASEVTGSQRIRLSVSYGKSLVCCGCCFDFLVMCIFIHVCKNKHFTLLPHRSLAIPCQQCQANVISSPGMTHFLLLWSSEIIMKAIAEMVWFKTISCITISGFFFPGSPFPLLFLWFQCSIFSQFIEAHEENWTKHLVQFFPKFLSS